MSLRRRAKRRTPLLIQLNWFIRLRWIAGGVVVIGSLASWRWLSWVDHAPQMTVVGLAILAYNFPLWLLTRHLPVSTRRRALMSIAAWGQIFLDLVCLTLLVVWTGGLTSPLLGFYVFHMVFASLLLQRYVAYASATVAMLMLSGGLFLSAQWPSLTSTRLVLLGWVLTLLFTVYLSNHITRNVRRQARRLVRQNRRIRAMTTALREQQQAMIQHEKMVALGQMAAGVAHEIANPLASLDSVLQLIERHPERMKPERHAALRQQVDRIRQTIQQMSDFAHPAEVQWQTVPVDELVATALAMVRFDRRHRNIDTQQQLLRPCCHVHVQPQAIQQVLVNIMLNAFDAVAEVPEPRVVVGSECCGDSCRISISDNGRGVAPGHLDRLFEPFFTTKPIGKGTGLGLAISYNLIRNQGGSIDVTSDPGRGATFCIHLPVSQREASKQCCAAESTPPASPGPT